MAVKLAEVEPADTVTATGTVNGAALLDRLTVAPPVAAALDKVTEHAAVADDVRLAGEQVTALTMVLAVSKIETETEVPLYAALIDADWPAEKLPAVAVKLTD